MYRKWFTYDFCWKNSLRVQPPLVITKEQIDKAVDIIDKVMNDYENGRIGDEVFEHMQGW